MLIGKKDIIALENLLSDTSFWGHVRATFLDAVRPIFTELYLGGVEGGLITLRKLERQAKKDVGEDFITLSTDPEFAARAARFITAYSENWWELLDNSTRKSLYNILERAKAAQRPPHRSNPAFPANRCVDPNGLRRAISIAHDNGLLDRFGTMAELGRLYGVSRERVRQIASVSYPGPKGQIRSGPLPAGRSKRCGLCGMELHNRRTCACR